MKWWDTHTKKLKYCSSAKSDEGNNKFGKWWSPGYSLITGTNIDAPPMLQIDLSDHPFIKDDIFEAIAIFSLRGTPIGIIFQHCDHHNMSYFYQSTNNIPCNREFHEINRTNVCIISIGRRYSTTVWQVMKAFSS